MLTNMLPEGNWILEEWRNLIFGRKLGLGSGRIYAKYKCFFPRLIINTYYNKVVEVEPLDQGRSSTVEPNLSLHKLKKSSKKEKGCLKEE